MTKLSADKSTELPTGPRLMRGRVLVCAAFVAIAAVIWVIAGERVVSIGALREFRMSVQDFATQQTGLAATLFFLSYLVVAALALPGALFLTLLGGALFGFWAGIALVALSATSGAFLSLVLVRLLAGNALRERLEQRLTPVAEGVRREGAYYLFTLRVLPVMPFFLVNVLMALTPISRWTFIWVSAIGMLPATIIYVNAGHELASIESISGLLSPGLMVSLSLLAVFPLLIRRPLLAVAQRTRQLLDIRRAERLWLHLRPKRLDRDLLVIGGGSAGLVAAYAAASLRAKVTLVERAEMGGDCLNTGCVPSKALLDIAHSAYRSRELAPKGVKFGEASVDFPRVMAHVRQTIAAIAPHDSADRYRELGVECLFGEARVRSPWEVTLTRSPGQEELNLTARRLVIATGAEPVVPDIPGLAAEKFFTSATVWSLEELPSRLLVIGGGPVGCELAQAFSRLGSKVTLVEREGRLLIHEEPAVSALMLEQFLHEGLDVHLGATVLAVSQDLDGDRATLQSGERVWDVGFDKILVALGRRARVSGAGLDALGLGQTEDGTLQVDDWMRTSNPLVHAAGDVATRDRFTHVAAAMGWSAACNALLGALWPMRVRTTDLPRSVYTDPEIARVGPSLEQLRQSGLEVEVTRYSLDEFDRAIIEDRREGFVQIITARGRDVILGATVAGPRASDLVSLFALAIRYRLGMRKILATTFPYPAWSSAASAVSGQWQRDRAPVRLLQMLERWHAWRRD